MSDRLDVRRMLLQRGWKEDGTMLRKGGVSVAWRGPGDLFLSGPARGRPAARTTVVFAGDVPARVVAAACDAWPPVPVLADQGESSDE